MKLLQYPERARLTERASPAPATRIFTACHGTQLLVIQHLRRHLRRPPAREFLIWHPLGDNETIDRLMRVIVPEAGFDDTLDVRRFHSLQSRTQGALAWWFESVRRLRNDASELRAWIAANGIDETTAELWADDPLHFYAIFPRAVLHRARQVKIPHSFNHEDCTSQYWKATLEAQWASAPWTKKFVFLPWQRWASAVDMRMERVTYDHAYTFALPSAWCANSIDLSALISLDAFADTYQSLPGAIRAEVDAIVAPIRSGARPLVLLLLFGMGEYSQDPYRRAIARVFHERANELRGGTLAVKWHPSATGGQERLLVDWLKANLPVQVHEIPHPLNLEFMLPELRPDFVLAGLCGALPIVRDLRVSRSVVLTELMPENPAKEWKGGCSSMKQFLRGIEVW